jgi:ubiquinol-cytochrome c reductase iron-sulfur subunit
MSNQLEPLADPGVPVATVRRADIDPIAAKRAERQVALLFSLSGLGTLLFIYSFFFIKDNVLTIKNDRILKIKYLFLKIVALNSK